MNNTNLTKIIRIICLLLTAGLVAMTFQACETPEGNKMTDEGYISEHSRQLIPDVYFKKGITILSQKDHNNGDRVVPRGTFSFTGEEVTSPRWELAQWDSGLDLYYFLTEFEGSTISDGGNRIFAFDSETNTMTFTLDTSVYYRGNPAKAGNYWPHLLVQQGNFGLNDLPEDKKIFYRCDSDSLVLSMDIILDEFEMTEVEGDWTRAAQFLIYFYVKGIDTNDFCWFGLSLFDNRWKTCSNYIAYDGGKPDASSALIYLIGSSAVYNENNFLYDWNGDPSKEGTWAHIELDLRPYLDDMLKKGLEDGYFKADSLSELKIDGMNIGFETIGTFRHTIRVKDLKLVSTRSDTSRGK